MKKTLIASAIAAATISSTAFAMDPATALAERLDSMPTIYGNIQLAYINSKVDAGGGETSTNSFEDNGSTLGFAHSHEIAPGVEGFFKAEFHFDADDQNPSEGNGNEAGGGVGLGEAFDEAYVGVKGSFGSVLVGSDDTTYEDMVDMIDFTEAVFLQGELAADVEGDQIKYLSPEIAGGLTVGVSLGIASTQPYSGQIGAKYSTDMFDIGIGYSLGATEGLDYGDAIGLAGAVKLGDLAVILQYETKDADENGGTEVAGSEQEYIGLAGIYTMGANQFAIAYQMREFSGGPTGSVDSDQDMIFLQAKHNLSDNLYAYVEYHMFTTEFDSNASDIDADVLFVGTAYAF